MSGEPEATTQCGRLRLSAPRVALAVALILLVQLRAQDTSFLGRSAQQWAADLSHTNPQVRRSAAFALGQLREQAAAALPWLVRLLHDADPSVRESAAVALGQMRRAAWEDVVLNLCDMLGRDSAAGVRRAAAFALGSLAESVSAAGQPLAAAPRVALERALEDSVPEVRQNAAWALGQFGAEVGPEAARKLSQLLQDTDELVRRDAANALGELGQAASGAVSALLARYQDDPALVVRQAALTALVNVVGPTDTAAGRVLRPALHDENAEMARAAAFALANIGGPDAADAVPILCATLHEDTGEGRRLAVAALLRLGPQAAAAVPALSAALADADPAVRRTAALALGRTGSAARDAIPRLLDLLERDRDENVRTNVAEALATLSPGIEPAVPTLQRLVTADRNTLVRVKAVIALGRLHDLGGRETAPLLEAVLSETTPETRLVRYNAAVVLALHLGSKASEMTVDVLELLLDDKQIQVYGGSDANVRSAGAEAQSGTATVRRKYGGDGRVLAAHALARIGPRANRPALVRSLEAATRTEDRELREAATVALRRLLDKPD